MLKLLIFIAVLSFGSAGYGVQIVRTAEKNVTNRYELILKEQGQFVVETVGHSLYEPRILKWHTTWSLKWAILIWGGELKKGLEGRHVELVTGQNPKRRIEADRVMERD